MLRARRSIIWTNSPPLFVASPSQISITTEWVHPNHLWKPFQALNGNYTSLSLLTNSSYINFHYSVYEMYCYYFVLLHKKYLRTFKHSHVTSVPLVLTTKKNYHFLSGTLLSGWGLLKNLTLIGKEGVAVYMFLPVVMT